METWEEPCLTACQEQSQCHDQVGEFRRAIDCIVPVAAEIVGRPEQAFQCCSLAVSFVVDGHMEIDETHDGGKKSGIWPFGIPGQQRHLMSARGEFIGHQHEHSLGTAAPQAGGVKQHALWHRAGQALNSSVWLGG